MRARRLLGALSLSVLLVGGTALSGCGDEEGEDEIGDEEIIDSED